MTTEMLRSGDARGCALCGIARRAHPDEVHGLGHMRRTTDARTGKRLAVPSVPPLSFVQPSEELVAERLAYRRRSGYALAEIDAGTGEPRTDLVVTACRCGAKALATPTRISGARCGTCIRVDAEAATSAGDYDMTATR